MATTRSRTDTKRGLPARANTRLGLTLLVGLCMFAACGSDGEATTSTASERAETSTGAASCDGYVGVWEADEEAGSEDEVGGVYRATLQIPPSGEVSWSESDFIEVWNSWGCVGDLIVGFSDSSVRWVDGQQVAREPNPCQDMTVSAPREALPEDDTIDSTSTWVRCRSGRFEEGITIATAKADGTLTRGGFTLTR